MNSLRPNDARAKRVIIFIWITMGLQLISAISAYFQYQLLNDVKNGVAITMEAATANDLREGIINFVLGIIYLLTAIFFIMWFRRAYYNLKQKSKLTSYTDGWAAGAWFVPILNLFRPFQIMKELYTLTPSTLKKHGITSPIELNQNLLGIWWTLWIVVSVIDNVSFRMSFRAETLDSLINSTLIGIVSSILFIPLSIVIVKIIKAYNQVEPSLAEVGDEKHFDAFVDDKI